MCNFQYFLMDVSPNFVILLAFFQPIKNKCACDIQMSYYVIYIQPDAIRLDIFCRVTCASTGELFKRQHVS